jgi:hypothetical protein
MAIGLFFTVSDEKSKSDFFAKAKSLTDGLIYKKTNYLNLLLLSCYTVMMLFNLEIYDQKSQVFTIINVSLVLLNIATPLINIYRMEDRETAISAFGEPT